MPGLTFGWEGYWTRWARLSFPLHYFSSTNKLTGPSEETSPKSSVKNLTTLRLLRAEQRPKTVKKGTQRDLIPGKPGHKQAPLHPPPRPQKRMKQKEIKPTDNRAVPPGRCPARPARARRQSRPPLGPAWAGSAVTWAAAALPQRPERRGRRWSLLAAAGPAVPMGPGRLSWSLLRCWRRAAAAALGAPRCRPLPSRPLSAAVPLWAPLRPPGTGGGAPWDGAAGAGGDEEEEDEEALEELLGPSPLAPGPGAQRVAIVHPAVKWGPQKSPLTTGAGLRRAGGLPER